MGQSIQEQTTWNLWKTAFKNLKWYGLFKHFTQSILEYFVWNVVYIICNVDLGMKWYILNIPIPFLVLQSFLSMSSLKVILSRIIRPRCLYEVVLWTILLLKTRSGWSIILDTVEKQSSGACFKRPGMKNIFLWNVQSLIIKFIR